MTDKSGKLAVCTPDAYERMGEVHVANDVVVKWDVVEEAQKTVGAHLKCLNKVFKTGEAHVENESKRTKGAKQVCNLVVPLMYLLMKDHKAMGDDGLPKTRPVCGASTSLNQEMSEWVSDVLEAVLDSETENHEAISTEDMLPEIDRLNQKWIEEGKKVDPKDIFIGSLDAEALYPSLDTKKCARMCGKLFEESPLELKGIDYEWASLYIALNSKPWQIRSWRMGDIIPRRRFKSGQRPGITGCMDPMARYRWKWEKHPETYSKEEKKKILGRMMEIMILATFR